MKPSTSVILVSLLLSSVSCSNLNLNNENWVANANGINFANHLGNSANMQHPAADPTKETFISNMLAQSWDHNLRIVQMVMAQHQLQMHNFDTQIQQLQQARLNQQQLYATYMDMAHEGLARQKSIIMAQASNTQSPAQQLQNLFHMQQQQPMMQIPQLKTQVQMMGLTQVPMAPFDFLPSLSTVNHQQPVQMAKYTPKTQKTHNEVVSVSNEVTESSLASVSSSSVSSDVPLIEKKTKKVTFETLRSDTEDTPMSENVPKLITRRFKKAKNSTPAVTIEEERGIEAMNNEEIDATLSNIKELREKVRDHALLKLVMKDLESAKKRPRK